MVRVSSHSLKGRPCSRTSAIEVPTTSQKLAHPITREFQKTFGGIFVRSVQPLMAGELPTHSVDCHGGQHIVVNLMTGPNRDRR